MTSVSHEKLRFAQMLNCLKYAYFGHMFYTIISVVLAVKEGYRAMTGCLRLFYMFSQNEACLR